MFIQLYDYMETFLNQLLCGFRKTHSTQHVLFRLIQSLQKELDQSGFVGPLLTSLSKDYYCIPHDLMVAKLEAYDLAIECLQLISDYLSDHKQRKKFALHIVIGQPSLAEFLEALYWVLYISIFLLMKFSCR